MAEHKATIRWRRETPDFEYKTFDRAHVWDFPGGQSLQSSSAPEYFGNPEYANPEEGLVASLSSCHMLTFLAIAARKRLTVDLYEDEASGILEKNPRGRMLVTRITLRPRVVFGGDNVPDGKTLAAMHHKAHENCFVANSLLTEVSVEPR